MQENYYEQLIEQIKQHIQEEEYLKASQLLEEELKMPYVPAEIESQLLKLMREVAPYLKRDEQGKRVLSVEQIEDYLLRGNESQQVQAVEALYTRNLRDFIDIIKNYLEKTPSRIVASLLIDACIDQQIRDEIKYNIDGLEMIFIPSVLEKPVETDGFKIALAKLTEWFENENPSFLVLCMETLIQQVYLKLPESYEEDEGELLAISIASRVYQLLSDEEGMNQFLIEHKVEKEQLLELYS